MSGDTPTGCGSISCIIAPAAVGVGVCSCLNELTPAIRVPLQAVVAGLRAEVERLREDELAALWVARESFQRMTGSDLTTVKQLAPLAESLVERLTHEHSQEVLGLQSNAAAVKVQTDARTEQLTELHGRATEHGVELSEQVSTLESTIKQLQRDLCQAWGLDELGQRFPGQAARDRAARAVAKRQAWDCYPDDSTTDELGGDQ